MEISETNHKIVIDGQWDLEDLYVFPKAYEQVYFMVFSLLPHDDEYIIERIRAAYSAFPWQGGYSVVNFYNQLKYTVPKQKRPQIVSLKYASEGWIELRLIKAVAQIIESTIQSIANSILHANRVYSEIYRGIQERKLLRFKVKDEELRLEELHGQYIENSVERMTRLIGLDNVEKIHAKTGSKLRTLKILLSLYRRIRTLAEFENQKKINLETVNKPDRK